MTDGYVLLVDDVRSFKDGRPAEIARTAEQAIAILRARRSERISQLWLDHDLAGRQNAGTVTVMPVIDELIAAHERGEPYDIGVVHIHTSNPAGAVAMRAALAVLQVPVRRSYAIGIWVNRRTELEPQS